MGAGAAGLATAIFTRRLNPSLSVVLLDSAKKPGAKILVSGGTRCNVTNRIVTEKDFWGGKTTVTRHILRAFPVSETISFFESLGVALHEEAGGKLFPATNRARDVLDALLREVQRAGAELRAGVRVIDVTPAHGGFRIATPTAAVSARAVVLATGGMSLPKTGSDGGGLAIARRLGHTIIATTPALVPLTLAEPGIHRQLSGVSLDVELTVWIDGSCSRRLKGPMLWTHTGVSGPVALDASRHWMRARIEGRDVRITANFLNGEMFDTADAALQSTGRSKPKSPTRAVVASRVPASLADVLLRSLQIDGELPLSQLVRDDRRALTRALTEWPLAVTGTRGYNYAEVTAGGVSLDEVDPATLESRVCKGLRFAGEILDVDGRIGGFNFQWAWSSAYVAARALTRW